MYSYHNTIRSRISRGELIGCELCGSYKKIGRCALLIFSSPPFVRPVRPEKYYLYSDVFDKFSIDDRR